MEITRIIEGEKEKFFSILMQSLLEDVQGSTKKTVKMEDLKQGYSYKKELSSRGGSSGKVRVSISKLKAPEVYAASFTSSQGKNTLSYNLEDVDDSHFKVVYTEDFESASTAKNLNYRLMSFLYKRSSKKKANLVLNQIEALMNE